MPPDLGLQRRRGAVMLLPDFADDLLNVRIGDLRPGLTQPVRPLERHGDQRRKHLGDLGRAEAADPERTGFILGTRRAVHRERQPQRADADHDDGDRVVADGVSQPAGIAAHHILDKIDGTCRQLTRRQPELQFVQGPVHARADTGDITFNLVRAALGITIVAVSRVRAGSGLRSS